LGVDITASLLETALRDGSFWSPAVTAPGAAVAGQTASVSQQQLRMQYAAAIVRCVKEF
jgi:hypothetical protein